MQQIITTHKTSLAEHERTYFHRVFQLNRRIPQFYTIPKVHKLPWKTRPIVSCVNSNLGYLSKFVDRHLQRVVHLCPAYLKDTFSLLDRLQALGPLPPTARLITADAVSMYTNIHTEHGLETLTNWFQLHQADLPPLFPVDMLLAATRLIMTPNAFQFDNTYWLQLSGTAMGTSLACMYATIYYSFHEETSIFPILQANDDYPGRPLLLYARLIDDAFQVWDIAKLPPSYTVSTFVEDLQNNMAFGTLTWEAGPLQTTANFLDLTITITPIGTLSTRTFIKPMNLHLYIPPHSAHTKGVLKSLIFGTVQPYWVQHTNKNEFTTSVQAFHKHLLNRGYT
jgi:hypothetical protein